MVAIGRSGSGWGVLTRFWGTGHHPNISGSGWTQELCHGAVQSSVLAETKDGTNLLNKYHSRNGSLSLKEAIKAANLVAELLEASLLSGDSGRGFVHTSYRDISYECLLPLQKWNTFDLESVPEEVREVMERVYMWGGNELMFPILPGLVGNIKESMSSNWFWEPPKNPPGARNFESEAAPSLTALRDAFRVRDSLRVLSEQEAAAGLQELFG
jgi:hypothetical protein